MYKRPVEKDVRGATSGHFKRLCSSLLMAERSEDSDVDDDEAAASAEDLHKAGEGRLGTDESAFNAIFAAQSRAQLCAVSEHYRAQYGKDIVRAIEKEMGGSLAKGMIAIGQLRFVYACRGGTETHFVRKQRTGKYFYEYCGGDMSENSHRMDAYVSLDRATYSTDSSTQSWRRK